MNSVRVASPLNRLPTLVPPAARRPRPFEARRSISVASAGRFETSRRPVSFSNQRKAGMLSLFPWRIPAWLAEVCDGGTHSHSTRRYCPERTQLAIRGVIPTRIALRRIGAARPSIWTTISPEPPVTRSDSL